MIAVEKGFVTIVEMLIKNNATKKLKIMERKFLLQISIYHKRYQVLKLLSKDLSKHFLDQNDIDKILQHSLKLSIIEEFIEGVEYFLNRNDWKNLMRRRPKTELNSILKSPMQLLIEHLPQMALIVFDKCFVIAYITVLNKTKEVTFADYEFLDDVYFIQNNSKVLKNDDLSTYDKATGKLKPEAKSRTNPYNKIVADHPLQLMLKQKRYELFSHKLVESYITTKWNNFVKWGYYFYCFYHFIFVIFLSFVIITIPPDKVVSSQENQKPHLDSECLMNPLQKFFAAIFALIHLIMTSYKIYRYFNFLSRSLDILIVLLTFTAALPFCQQLNNTIEWSILTILYLFVWMSLLNLLKKLPRFGIYVLMIFYTLKVFLRFAPVFIMFLLPFVVSFYVLLYDKVWSFMILRIL
uniref:Uncharacterized protein n=1 Tax=Panagrolaimus sp. PS1159 TaxID=55785 RepID=A0AC35GIZ3_9BILA